MGEGEQLRANKVPKLLLVLGKLDIPLSK